MQKYRRFPYQLVTYGNAQLLYTANSNNYKYIKYIKYIHVKEQRT